MSQQKCNKRSPNCSDHKLTQLLISRPVAVPSTCCIFQEFVADSDMSDVLLVLLEIDLSSHRSIGLFILTIDSQYNVPSEIIATCYLSNDLPGTICITFVLKFQQTALFGRVFWGAPQNPMRMQYALPRCRLAEDNNYTDDAFIT